MDISIIIPTYHRCDTLEYLVRLVVKVLENYSYEIIFVQDGLNQFTKEEQAIVHKKYLSICEHSFVSGIILEENRGQQNALLAGMRVAKGLQIISFDDDRKELKDLLYIIEALNNGADGAYIVEAKNKKAMFKHQKPIYRRIGTFVKESIFYLFLGKPQNIQLTSYRGFNRKTTDFIIEDTHKQVYISARVLQKTKKLVNIEGDLHSKPSDTGYKFSKLLNIVLSLLVNYSQVPIIRKFAVEGQQYKIKEYIQ